MTELNSEVTASLSVIIISLDTGLFNIDLEGITAVHSVPVLKTDLYLMFGLVSSLLKKINRQMYHE